MKTALATKELGLRLTVASVGEAAYRATLRCVPWVYRYNLAAEGFGLILKESLQLSETPRVKSAAGFSMIDLDMVPDIREVLNHDSGTRFNAVQDRLGNNVVAIPSEALFTLSEASKVPLGRLRTVGLQCTSETKDTFDDFLHVPIAMKAVIGANGRTGNAEVNAESLAVRSKDDVRKAYNDVEVEPSLAINKVSRSCFSTDRILSIVWKSKENLCSTTGGGQANNAFVPVDLESVRVVPGRTEKRLWTRDPLPSLSTCDCGLHCLSSLLSCLNMQVGHEGWQDSLAISVCQTMKRISIAIVLLPAYIADRVERLGELLHRFMQGFLLFRRSLEQDSNCSIHTWIITYTSEILQIRKGGKRRFLR